MLFLEARPAQHRPALRRLERNGGLRAALRTRGTRLRPHALAAPRTLRLALLAVLGVVLELLVVEELLLACGENKLGAAVDAFQHSIGEFHGRLPSQGLTPKSATALQDLAGPGSLISFVVHYKGPDRTKNRAVFELLPACAGNLTLRTQDAWSVIFRDSQFLKGLRQPIPASSPGRKIKERAIKNQSTETGESFQPITTPRSPSRSTLSLLAAFICVH